MKRCFMFLLLAAGFIANAQSVSTTVKFDKTDRPALMLYLPYNQDVAEGTILTKLKETGFEPESKGSLFWKQNKVDGYYVFKGVTLPNPGAESQLVDLYFKVDRRGSKKDNQSVMYMMTSKGGENFVTSTTEIPTYTAAQTFLNGFVGETASYKHTLDIKTQEETVQKAEKKLTDLLDEERDLNKRLQKLQEDMAKNKQNQTSQQATIEAERRKLIDMRAAKPAM